MCKFYIGQPVVCTGDYSEEAKSDWAVLFGIEFPERDGVYTVRRIVCRPDENDEDRYGIMLDEVLNLPNPLNSKGGGYQMLDGPGWQEPDEIAFLEDDFRPLLTVGTFVDVKQRKPVDA